MDLSPVGCDSLLTAVTRDPLDRTRGTIDAMRSARGSSLRGRRLRVGERRRVHQGVPVAALVSPLGSGSFRTPRGTEITIAAGFKLVSRSVRTPRGTDITFHQVRSTSAVRTPRGTDIGSFTRVWHVRSTYITALRITAATARRLLFA